MRCIIVVGCMLALAGCNGHFGGPPLISAQSPASAGSAASEPQPVNSLPPGAAGQATGPNATQPNEASYTFKL